jgi:hypothetical protein
MPGQEAVKKLGQKPGTDEDRNRGQEAGVHHGCGSNTFR